MALAPEVLIIGAGPTGLMLALQLGRRGVRVRIVDRNSGPARESRAVVVQARTLEFFDQMGFADAAVRAGRPISRLRLLHRGRIRAELPVGRLGLGKTRFPFMLALGQDQTEDLLLAQLASLGAVIERRTEATEIEDLGSTLRVRLMRHDGERASEETIEVPWLCGCDGASSVVRHALSVPFEGGTYEHRFYLADCRVDGPVADDGVTVAPEAQGLVAFFAMAGERRFRVLGRVPTSHPVDAPLSFEAMSDHARRTSELPITLSAPRWTSVYRLHHRCAAALRAGRAGRVFILGDAAHVHSPVGGQGMNTGLQDATNLAWKLAMVLRGAAESMLPASFGEERLPVAHRLLHTTDRIFNFATNDGKVVRLLRGAMLRWVAPHILRVQRAGHFIFRAVSQTGIGYQHAGLAALARSFGALPAPLAPGERLPFVDFAAADGAPRQVADLCTGPWFTALTLGASGSDAMEAALIAHPSLDRFVARRHLGFSEGHRAALACFGVVAADAPRLALVRPDLHLFGLWPLSAASRAMAALDAALRSGDR